MPNNHTPTPKPRTPGTPVRVLVDGDPPNADNLFVEVAPGGTPNLTLGYLLAVIDGILGVDRVDFTALGPLTVDSEFLLASPLSDTRVVGLGPMYDQAEWSLSATHGRLVALTNTGVSVRYYLEIPYGVAVQSIEVTILPDTGHGAVPAVPPSITWAALNVTTNAAVAATGGTATDTAIGSVGAYETMHTITLTGAPHNLPHTHLATTNRLLLTVLNESGANAMSGLQIVGVRATWTRSRMGRD